MLHITALEIPVLTHRISYTARLRASFLPCTALTYTIPQPLTM